MTVALGSRNRPAPSCAASTPNPPAEGDIALTDTVQVRGPVGRIGPFESVGEDGHQLGVGVGHRVTSGAERVGAGRLPQCPVRPSSAPGNPRILRNTRRRARRRARPAPMPSAGRRSGGEFPGQADSPSVIPAKNRSFTSSAAVGNSLASRPRACRARGGRRRWRRRGW